MVIARSLKDAARLGSATTSLLLRRSEDLVCQNLMCAKLGEACLCRLAVHLSRLGGLKELDIAGNELGILPEPVFELPALEHLDASGGCDVGRRGGRALAAVWCLLACAVTRSARWRLVHNCCYSSRPGNRPSFRVDGRIKGSWMLSDSSSCTQLVNARVLSNFASRAHLLCSRTNGQIFHAMCCDRSCGHWAQENLSMRSNLLSSSAPLTADVACAIGCITECCCVLASAPEM